MYDENPGTFEAILAPVRDGLPNAHVEPGTGDLSWAWIDVHAADGLHTRLRVHRGVLERTPDEVSRVTLNGIVAWMRQGVSVAWAPDGVTPDSDPAP